MGAPEVEPCNPWPPPRDLLERARSQKDLEHAEAEALREADRGRQEQRLDDAIARDLERMAAEEAWDLEYPPPPDPHAPQFAVRTQREHGDKYLVVGYAQQSKAKDELRVEFHRLLRD